MELHLDTSWCPVCSRQILPKRYTVPIAPPAPAPITSAPANSAQPSPKTQEPTPTRRTKGALLKQQRGGLVQGTGRVKPNGTIKRSDSPNSNNTAPPTPALPTAAQPVKTRTVFDQGPIPLYCSEECQIKDLSSMYGALDIDYNPNRHSLPLPPVPHNSYSSNESGSYSSSGLTSSVDSIASSSPVPESPAPPSPLVALADMSPSMATLFQIYNWKIPPPAPLCPPVTTSSTTKANNYDNGSIMTGRRINATFRRNSQAKSVPGSITASRTIPGWTDGSDAWRAQVYNLVAPQSDPQRMQESASRAYGSYVASPHRSHGVQSTLGQHAPTSWPSQSTTSSSPVRTSDSISTEELYAKYSQSFSRLSEFRASQYPSSASQAAHSYPSAAPRRERSLVHPDARGQLLVPDIKLKVRGASSSSLPSMGRTPTSPRSDRSRQERSEGHEPMSDSENRDTGVSMPMPRRPAPETRSWSCDNLYDMMPLPTTKEKRIQKEIVDGVEKDVEVEVEVVQPIKRLFRFAGDASPRLRDRTLTRT